METLYSKNDFIEKENREILNEIAGTNKLCVKFDISCKEVNGAWGIWFNLGEEELLVNPLDLVNSVYEDDTYYLLEKRTSTESVVFHVGIRMSRFCYIWRIFNPNKPNIICMSFSLQDYIDSTKSSVNSLCDVWEKGVSIAYTDSLDCKLEGIRICCKQIDVKGVISGYYRLMTKDIKSEVFTFNPVRDEYNEEYTIGIGDRQYDTFLTHWDNDYEQIRHQLEMLAFTQKAEIELSFDISVLTLKIERRSILDQMTTKGEGTGFKYKEYALVEIIPNEFAQMPIIKGYCDYKNTVRTFYESLLRLAMAHTDKGYVLDHEPPRIVAYNKFKSPIIENLITDTLRDESSYETRQQKIKTILTIDPDVDQVFIDQNGCSYSFDSEGILDDDEIVDRKGKPICMKEMHDWQLEIEPIIIASETGQPYSKDWKDFHERGLKHAHKLRKQLSPEIDLWYAAPFEDKSGIIDRPILIL